MKMTQRDLLVGLQRFEFAQAAALDKKQLILQGVIASLAVVCQFLPGNYAAAGGVLIFLVVIAAFFLIYRCKQRRAIAEKARRATLLVGGLGLVLAHNDEHWFRNKSSLEPDELAKWNDPNFFNTTQEPGERRLIEMLRECALFSSHSFQASANKILFLLAGSFLTMLLCLLLGYKLQDVPTRVFTSLASSLIFFELLMRYLQYGEAVSDTDSIVQRLALIQEAGYPKDGFLLVLGDYNSIVEGAPLMFPGIYDTNQDKLNKDYDSTYG